MDKKGTIGRPLSPELMTELGALGNLPNSAGGFDPLSEWEHSYRIWSCYGYWEKNNKNDGWVKISKSVQPGNELQTLKIKQVVNNFVGRKNEPTVFTVIEAQVTCSMDSLSSVSDWTVSRKFVYEDESLLMPQTQIQKTGSLLAGNLVRKINGRKNSQSLPGKVSSNWGLFEAVQRMPLDTNLPLEFTLLEDFDLLKKNHKLSYRRTEPSSWLKENQTVHYFQQTGDGVFPFEYWLDKNHQLFLVTSGPRAYVLDDKATHMFDELYPKMITRL